MVAGSRVETVLDGEQWINSGYIIRVQQTECADKLDMRHAREKSRITSKFSLSYRNKGKNKQMGPNQIYRLLHRKINLVFQSCPTL